MCRGTIFHCDRINNFCDVARDLLTHERRDLEVWNPLKECGNKILNNYSCAGNHTGTLYNETYVFIKQTRTTLVHYVIIKQTRASRVHQGKHMSFMKQTTTINILLEA